MPYGFLKPMSLITFSWNLSMESIVFLNQDGSWFVISAISQVPVFNVRARAVIWHFMCLALDVQSCPSNSKGQCRIWREIK